ncbi:MAG: hypothetical protein SFX73_40310 [Kofleriaceae bacterium]|nr:hypothetical protein [Kofleriaceae bacterium]
MRSTILLLALVTGCSVGEVALNGGGPDGGGGGGGDGGGLAAACVNRGQIGLAHQHAGGGTNAGTNCMDGVACHAAGGAGGTFTAAGTLYKADKVTPDPGAAVRIFSGGQTYTAFADDAGNFRFTQAITYPATTDASACPDAIPMLTQLRAGDGACARAGCHVAGAQGVVYLP